MLLPKMKPGERVLLEVSCIEDERGRVTLMVDVVEKMPNRVKPRLAKRLLPASKPDTI